MSDVTKRAREALDGDGTWKPVGPWSNLVADLLAEVETLWDNLAARDQTIDRVRALADRGIDPDWRTGHVPSISPNAIRQALDGE